MTQPLSAVQQDRIAWRRRQTTRSILVAAGSTAVVGALLVVAVTGAPGWDRVRQSFLDPSIAVESLPADHVLLNCDFRMSWSKSITSESSNNL